MLSVEELNDLRRRVLSNQPLTLEESKQVTESLRKGYVSSTISEPKPKKGKAKGISDEDLDKDLDSLLNL